MKLRDFFASGVGNSLLLLRTMAIAVTELLQKDVKMQRKIPKHREMFAGKLLG